MRYRKRIGSSVYTSKTTSLMAGDNSLVPGPYAHCSKNSNASTMRKYPECNLYGPSRSYPSLFISLCAPDPIKMIEL